MKPIYILFTLLFASGLSAQKISLSGQLVFDTDPEQKPGKCTIDFTGGQMAETNKKGAFSLGLDASMAGDLLNIKAVHPAKGDLKAFNLRDLQYILVENKAADHPLMVFLMTETEWEQRQSRIGERVEAHYPVVLRRLLGTLRGMNPQEAQNLSQILQSAYPQYKSLLIDNLASTVPSRLSPDGQKAFSLLLDSQTGVTEALKLLTPLAKADTPASRYDLRLLAELQVLNFDIDKALGNYRQLVDKNPEDLGLLMEFKEAAIVFNHSDLILPGLEAALGRVKSDDFQGRNHNDLASVYHLQNDYVKAVEETNVALTYLYRLERADPKRYRLETTAVLFNLGNVYQEMKTEDAMAVATFDTVLYRIQAEPGWQSDQQLMNIYFFANHFAGKALSKSKNPKAAYPYFERMFVALRQHPEVVRNFPKDQLFGNYLNYCEGKEANGATSEELAACFEESIGWLEESNDGEKQSLGKTAVYFKIAQIQQAKGETEMALRFYRRAIDALDDGQTAKTMHYACNLLNCTAALLGDYGRDEEAQTEFRHALEKAQSLRGIDPVDSKRNLGQIWYNIGIFYKKRIQADSAFAAFSRAKTELTGIDVPLSEDKSLLANTYNQTGALWSELKNDLVKAETDFTRALELYSDLADGNPVEHSLNAAMCANNLLSVQSDHLETADKKAALDLISKTGKRLRTPGLNPDEVKTYQQNMETYRKIFSGETGPFELAVLSLAPLQNQRKKISGNAGKSTVQRQIVAKLEQALEAAPADKKEGIKTLLAQESGNLSWYAIFDRQYALAETAARRALALDGTQTWVNSNLAHALLLQGKTAEAKGIYMRLKDVKHTDNRLFRVIFLEDIGEMKKAGITDPAFEEVILMLR